MDGERYSVAFPRRWWYPACRSSELGAKPLGFTLMDTPLVVFRGGDGSPAVLLDRCAHRNYPLSCGRLTGDGTLECGYHGWRYDSSGACVKVPGLLGDAPATASSPRQVPTYPATERDGVAWVWAEADAPPDREPFALPRIDGRGAGEAVFRQDLACTLHAALENALDVPHTAFLHRGIFRGGAPRRITAVRRALDDGVEVQYLGEPVGMGPIRAGEDSARTFDHWDRFFLPAVAQIEYAVDDWFRIVNTIVHLPLSPFRTRAWFIVRFWSRLPAAVVRPIVLLRGRQILGQDAKALARQAERIRSLGGERFSSTELDLIGTAIWHLMRGAERAERAEQTSGAVDDGKEAVTTSERRVTFEA